MPSSPTALKALTAIAGNIKHEAALPQAGKAPILKDGQAAQQTVAVRQDAKQKENEHVRDDVELKKETVTLKDKAVESLNAPDKKAPENDAVTQGLLDLAQGMGPIPSLQRTMEKLGEPPPEAQKAAEAETRALVFSSNFKPLSAIIGSMVSLSDMELVSPMPVAAQAAARGAARDV